MEKSKEITIERFVKNKMIEIIENLDEKDISKEIYRSSKHPKGIEVDFLLQLPVAFTIEEYKTLIKK